MEGDVGLTKFNDGIGPVPADDVHYDGDHDHDAAVDISISVWITKAEMVSRSYLPVNLPTSNSIPCARSILLMHDDEVNLRTSNSMPAHFSCSVLDLSSSLSPMMMKMTKMLIFIIMMMISPCIRNSI